MMENGKKLELPEGQEGVKGNQGFPLRILRKTGANNYLSIF